MDPDEPLRWVHLGILACARIDVAVEPWVVQLLALRNAIKPYVATWFPRFECPNLAVKMAECVHV